MNKIKSSETILDKWYKPRMHWKTFNRGQVIRAMEEYASQFKQPDISEDVWKAAEKHLTNLGIANTGGFTSRTILNSFEAGAEWQSKQPIPTVDEDDLWDEFADHYAYMVEKEPNITLPEVIEYFQKYFFITRK